MKDPAESMRQTEPLVSVEGVSRSFDAVEAVRSVSFEIEAGEIVGLLGPNGAGKTTTLRMMATLLRPDSGRIRIAGVDVTEAPLRARAHLGYQTGDTGLYERLTAREFLLYFGRLHGLTGETLTRRVRELIDAFALERFADRRCGALSTGEKQRVSLARAVLHDPQVLLLDEPTAGLDIIASSFVQDMLEAARRDEKAILFSTHILSEIELLADRVLVLHQGRIIARGTVQGIVADTAQPTFSRAYLSLVRENQAQRTATDQG